MIRLVSPCLVLLPSYFSFVEEMRALGETIWEGHVPKGPESEAQFIERLIHQETRAEHGLVCATSYWAVSGETVVGRISIRHELNEHLRDFGGHIGYEVRPSSRRQGIAKEMLRLILETPKAREIGRILLTCSPENVGSVKTITSNGGILEKTAFSVKSKRETHYFWVQLT